MTQPISTKADASCPICKGSNYVPDTNPRRQCDCTLRQRAIAYLTPVYADAKYTKSLKAESLVGRSILLAEETQATFKNLVKSFLLNTAMRYRHRTATGYEAMQGFLTNSETNEFTALAQVDFLVLYLAYDPRNREYNNVLSSLLDRRLQSKLQTWVYTPYSLNSLAFTNLYSEEFARFLRERFSTLDTSGIRTR